MTETKSDNSQSTLSTKKKFNKKYLLIFVPLLFCGKFIYLFVQNLESEQIDSKPISDGAAIAAARSAMAVRAARNISDSMASGDTKLTEEEQALSEQQRTAYYNCIGNGIVSNFSDDFVRGIGTGKYSDEDITKNIDGQNVEEIGSRCLRQIRQ